jgi:hypothetical protein
MISVSVNAVIDFAMAFSYCNCRFCSPNMIQSKMALAVIVFMVVAGAVRAQTLTDLGTNAPTPGTNDIAQLNITGNQTAPDGLNYYTDNQTGHNTGEPRCAKVNLNCYNQNELNVCQY